MKTTKTARERGGVIGTEKQMEAIERESRG
jgi:hypothetical protein